jgi:GC-rich sequence DNA-binding factor
MQCFVRRRLKLIRNLLLWRRIVPSVPDLIARVVSLVLRPIFVRTWERGGEDMAKKVGSVARIVLTWQVLEVAGQHLPPNLVSFLQSGK